METTTRPHLNTKEAAAFLGCAPQTLECDRVRRRWNVPFLRLGRKVIYDREALIRWLAEHQTKEG
jgi:hypothetical protein